MDKTERPKTKIPVKSSAVMAGVKPPATAETAPLHDAAVCLKRGLF